MNNVYDEASLLARMLKNSDEYTSYVTARDKAFKNQNTRKMIERYSRLNMKAQGEVVARGKADDATMDELKSIGNVLQFNRDAMEYLNAQYRLHKMMSDIFKILGDSVGIDLGMLEGN